MSENCHHKNLPICQSAKSANSYSPFEGSYHMDLPTFSKGVSLCFSYTEFSSYLDLQPDTIVHQSELPERESARTGQTFAHDQPIFRWRGPSAFLSLGAGEAAVEQGSCKWSPSFILKGDTQCLLLIRHCAGHSGQNRQASTEILRFQRSQAGKSRAGKTTKHGREQRVFQMERIAHRKTPKREYVKKSPQWPWRGELMPGHGRPCLHGPPSHSYNDSTSTEQVDLLKLPHRAQAFYQGDSEGLVEYGVEGSGSGLQLPLQ